ncbi:MAG: c-type cytochrome [Burkholderiales bacterium]
MNANPFLIVAPLLLLGGCAIDATVPSVALDHPANPGAPEAPITPLVQTLQSSDPVIAPAGEPKSDFDPMKGMDHGSMQGMDHSAMQHMDHGADHWMAPAHAAARNNPVPADAASIARGKKSFQTNCAVCHGTSGRGDGPAGAALNPRPANLREMVEEHSDGDFAWKIANGRGPMPAWKSVIKENQIWDLVNFIRSLGDKKTSGWPGTHDHGQHQH